MCDFGDCRRDAEAVVRLERPVGVKSGEVSRVCTRHAHRMTAWGDHHGAYRYVV